MRDYLSEKNVRRALPISALVTVMAAPRMLLAGVNLAVYLPACLLSMLLVTGAATAWGHYGGLHGLLPEWRRTLLGVGAGIVAALLALPWTIRFDLIRMDLLRDRGMTEQIALNYPGDPLAIVALLLWVAGFETLFFQAAVISYLARIFKRWRPALLGAILLRGLVWHAQIGGLTDEPGGYTLMAIVIGGAAISGGLYVAAGWPAAAVFAVILSLRHFWI